MKIPPLAAILISMTCLTSAGQVAGIGAIAAGGGLFEIALAQLIINLRYSLMSLSLSQKLSKNYNLFHRLTTSFGVTDEVFAVASVKPGEVTPAYMYGLNAGDCEHLVGHAERRGEPVEQIVIFAELLAERKAHERVAQVDNELSQRYFEQTASGGDGAYPGDLTG